VSHTMKISYNEDKIQNLVFSIDSLIGKIQVYIHSTLQSSFLYYQVPITEETWNCVIQED